MPGDSGEWHITLHGSPTFGASTKCKSKVEGWFHSALQWSPFPFVATSWDFGASLYYLATGNHEMARERLGDAAYDVAWDVLTIATAETASVSTYKTVGLVVYVCRGTSFRIQRHDLGPNHIDKAAFYCVFRYGEKFPQALGRWKAHHGKHQNSPHVKLSTHYLEAAALSPTQHWT